MKRTFSALLPALVLAPVLLAQDVHQARIIDEHEGQVDDLHCPVLTDCAIEAPKGEMFIRATIGDDSHWHGSQDTLNSQSSRFYSVKGGFPGTSTTLHLVTDHDNEYGFRLIESAKTPPDYTVVLRADDAPIQQRIAAAPAWVHREQWEREHSENDQLRAQIAKAHEETAEKVDAARIDAQKRAPTQFQSYEFDRAKAAKKPWLVSDILAGPHSTYIRRPEGAPDLPSVAAIAANGKPELILPHFDPDTGMYVVPQRIESGYLSFGGQKHEKRLAFRLPQEVASR